MRKAHIKVLLFLGILASSIIFSIGAQQFIPISFWTRLFPSDPDSMFIVIRGIGKPPFHSEPRYGSVRIVLQDSIQKNGKLIMPIDQSSFGSYLQVETRLIELYNGVCAGMVHISDTILDNGLATIKIAKMSVQKNCAISYVFGKGFVALNVYLYPGDSARDTVSVSQINYVYDTVVPRINSRCAELPVDVFFNSTTPSRGKIEVEK